MQLIKVKNGQRDKRQKVTNDKNERKGCKTKIRIQSDAKVRVGNLVQK